MRDIKLDIGAAEGPMCYENDNDVITLDLQAHCPFNDCSNYPTCKGRMTVIAAAEYLPFRDKIFDEAFSMSCVLLLTEDSAFNEMLRVSSNIVTVRAIAEGMHYLLDTHAQLIEEWNLTEIYEMGYERQLFAVIMTRQ